MQNNATQLQDSGRQLPPQGATVKDTKLFKSATGANARNQEISKNDKKPKEDSLKKRKREDTKDKFSKDKEKKVKLSEEAVSKRSLKAALHNMTKRHDRITLNDLVLHMAESHSISPKKIKSRLLKSVQVSLSADGNIVLA